MKKLNLLIAVAALAFTGAAKAQLVINSNTYDTAATLAGHVILTDFSDNTSKDTTLLVGSSSQVVSQPFSGLTGWVAGANSFTFSYNPSASLQLSSTGTGNANLSVGTTFSNPVNYVQLSLGASSTNDAFSVSNLTITSLDGNTTYLSPSLLSIASGAGSQNNDILDAAGLLKNGFKISGTLNLTSPLSNYSSSQLDKVTISVGYSAAAAPEPCTWALGLIGASALLYLRSRALRA